MEYVKLRELVLREAIGLSHGQLKDLSRELNLIKNMKYPSNRKTRYHLRKRGFTHEEYEKFMSVVDDPKNRVLYQFLATFGIRRDEATWAQGKDLQGDQLFVRDSKGGFAGTYKVPGKLLSSLEPVGQDESLFGKSYKQIGDDFARYRRMAGLDQVLGYTRPCGPHKTRNKEYRITIHSFRYYAIQNFYKALPDLELSKKKQLVQAFARHRDYEQTRGYLEELDPDFVDKDDVDFVLEKSVMMEAVRTYR